MKKSNTFKCFIALDGEKERVTLTFMVPKKTTSEFALNSVAEKIITAQGIEKSEFNGKPVSEVLAQYITDSNEEADLMNVVVTSNIEHQNIAKCYPASGRPDGTSQMFFLNEGKLQTLG